MRGRDRTQDALLLAESSGCVENVTAARCCSLDILLHTSCLSFSERIELVLLVAACIQMDTMYFLCLISLRGYMYLGETVEGLGCLRQ